ncbi:MAG: ABC transporter permease, partial [Gammaproteobacteria bacterium]|nr:ABC transporter permease [Gammaproteobacteria bacterium]NIW49343.1 ABC transporter permease [Gammaproteobacteria bacterium]
MASLNPVLKGLMRDWRSGELQMILIAVFIAVTSITTVGFFTDRIQRLTQIQANELLAADRVLRSSFPIEEKLIRLAKQQGLETTSTISFRSVVAYNDILELSELKAIESGYP